MSISRSPEQNATDAETRSPRTVAIIAVSLLGAAGVLATLIAWGAASPANDPQNPETTELSGTRRPASYPSSHPILAPRSEYDASGFTLALPRRPWPADSSLREVADYWSQSYDELKREYEEAHSMSFISPADRVMVEATRARLLMSEGKPAEAYEILTEVRSMLESESGPLMRAYLANIIHFQGLASLRRGENENCIMCRGESSCILPISAAAVHQNPSGSRQAIVHFTEYLEQFPDDLATKWHLNLAHMTLGEYPDGVDPRYRLNLDSYLNSEFDIGRFRDVGHIVGVNRFNQAGGAVLEDFDGDGLLDLAVTSFDVAREMALYHNTGQGKFEECAEEAGVLDQLGGLNCVQGDFDNDGLVDLFIIRGAWLSAPIRPTLLHNDGQMKFSDVTVETGLAKPINSIAAQWADYNCDGWLDLFVCSEIGSHLLYRNLGNGRFEECAAAAGLLEDGQAFGKGCTWLDFDNDDYPDLFVNYLEGVSQLYRNNRNGSFTNVSRMLGGGGTYTGFACWAWDFNNDGWLDIFSTCYENSVADIVRGMQGEPHQLDSNKLYLNLNGEGFRDVAPEMGLDMVFATMGCNYGDFDNDGFLDFYLGTGDPDVATLVPNRMFRNVNGERFSEITVSAGVGHLQKGHGVACGDWDRDGDVDIFEQLGGAIEGDQFHNILFQNPGQGHASVTLQLVGVQTNRGAIGTRIKLVTTGDDPLTVYRHVSSGSSFGANPLEQTIGLGDANGVEYIEIHWPTSGETQVFHDVPAGKIIRITEFEDEIEVITPTPIPLPPEPPAMQTAVP